MELKEGMYVRTEKGKIIKIEKLHIYEHDKILVNINGYLVNSLEILKEPSYNIIDLIEVGDYVNGEKITRVIPQDICGDEVLDYQHIFVNDREIFKGNVKSIVTKEQFESMSYKVGE